MYNRRSIYNIGDTYGNWEIIGHSEKRGKNGDTYVLCRCKCESQTIRDVAFSNLKRGISKSCGCLKPKTKNTYPKIKIGDKFGRLTIIDKSDKKNHWNCLCECGKEIVVNGTRLKTGVTKSCGCLNSEIKSITHRTNFTKSFETWCLENSLDNVLDRWDYELNKYLPNEIGYKSRQKIYLKCHNNIHESTVYTVHNYVNSYIEHGCGFYCNKCMKISSIHEETINNLLTEWKFDYERQYHFTIDNKKKSFSFDFYLPKFNVAIEYDGEQHFMNVNYGGLPDEKSEQRFSIIQKRDNLKDKYCKNNKITLIRIAYYEVDSIEDLQYVLWDKLVKHGLIKEIA